MKKLVSCLAAMSLVLAPDAHAGEGDRIFCDVVRSEVFAVVKASQSGVSLVSTLAEIQAKTNPGTNPVWTKKRINLAEGVYASKTKLNAKNEADFERAVCMRQGGRNYMETLKRPSNTWAQEKAELENRIRAEMQEIAAGGDPYGFSKPKRNLDEIDRDIARIDREMAANEALMRQNEADFQRRMQASAIEDEVKRQTRATNDRLDKMERNARANRRSSTCLVMPIGSAMASVDCN